MRHRARVGAAIAVLAVACLSSVGLAAYADYTPAVLDTATNTWMTTAKIAAANVKERFPNANYVLCKRLPDGIYSTLKSKVIGDVRYWNILECAGSLHVGPPKRIWGLDYHVKGECGTCWTITHLDGATVAMLKRKSPASNSGWFWGEGTADSVISHSVWISRNPFLDPDEVDCGGFGTSISASDGTPLYQHFRCRIGFASYTSTLHFWYRVDVTGKESFEVTKLKGVSLG